MHALPMHDTHVPEQRQCTTRFIVPQTVREQNKTKTNEVVIHRHGSDQQIPLKSSIKKATYNFRVFRQQHTYIATGKDTRFTVQKKAKIGIASRLQKCTNTERYNHQQLKEGAVSSTYTLRHSVMHRNDKMCALST